MNALADAVALLCAELSSHHVATVGSACSTTDTYTLAGKAAIEAKVPAPHRDVLQPLFDAWKISPSIPGIAIATAIDSVSAANAMTDAPQVDVVCTGPSSPYAAVRLTAQVVRQLIDVSATRVTISSFSSYKVASVMQALDDAIARGVRVELILESSAHLGGGGAESFGSHRVFVWPDELRPPNASMHAKAVIVDDRDVLLTSANLSNAAFDRNLELGALIRGGGVAKAMQRHFDALIAAGILQLVKSGTEEY